MRINLLKQEKYGIKVPLDGEEEEDKDKKKKMLLKLKLLNPIHSLETYEWSSCYSSTVQLLL
jgi:hypothetical protein